MRTETLQTAVCLKGVTKCYGTTVALNRFSLDIERRGVTCILGPNGAGKSTAIGLMLGRFTPDEGAVTLLGRRPRDVEARRRIGVMLQATTLPPQLTVKEQVALFAGYYPKPMRVTEAIGLAGLQGLESRRCVALSGGQQRRVQFALAVVGRPEVLILDEPTVGLDLEARRSLWATVRALVAAGTAVVLTTHHLEEAEALADRLVVIDHGRILASGSAAEMKALVSGRTIRCVTQLDDTALLRLPLVRGVEHSGRHAVIRTDAAEATLRALLAADDAVSDLTVSGVGLEDAFISLVGAADAAQGH